MSVRSVTKTKSISKKDIRLHLRHLRFKTHLTVFNQSKLHDEMSQSNNKNDQHIAHFFLQQSSFFTFNFYRRRLRCDSEKLQLTLKRSRGERECLMPLKSV